MNRIYIVVIAALLVTMIGCAYRHTQRSQEEVTMAKPRIGLFDSRAVAIAYGNSELFRQHLSSLTTEHNEAKEDGNEERIKELESKAQALQHLAHQQAFSTGSVSNILENIKDALPRIAMEARVSIIVSKWEIAYRDSSLETIDVTPQLVQQFNPDERALKWIEDSRNQSPIPIEEITLDID